MAPGGRHHSARELEFLKEAYKRDEQVAYGGNTLDLMDRHIVERFKGIEMDVFAASLAREGALVREQLDAQKDQFTVAFVAQEADRVNARRLQQELRHGSIKETKNIALLAQVKHVDREIEHLSRAKEKARTRSRRRKGGRGRGRGGRGKQSGSGSSAGTKSGGKGPNGFGTARRQERSDLEKMAQNISSEQALAIHTASQYASSTALQFAQASPQHAVIQNRGQNYALNNSVFSKYADQRAKAKDLPLF